MVALLDARESVVVELFGGDDSDDLGPVDLAPVERIHRRQGLTAGQHPAARGCREHTNSNTRRARMKLRERHASSILRNTLHAIVALRPGCLLYACHSSQAQDAALRCIIA
jgi:hypothetical protein